MPLYEYECTKGHRFEAIQKVSERPLKKVRGLFRRRPARDNPTHLAPQSRRSRLRPRHQRRRSPQPAVIAQVVQKRQILALGLSALDRLFGITLRGDFFR